VTRNGRNGSSPFSGTNFLNQNRIKMKRAILAFAIVATLVSCGSGESTETVAVDSTSVDSVAVDSVKVDTAAVK
jgi:hypothetical protein